MCDCKICKDHRDIQAVIERRDVEELIALVKHLSERVDNLAMDLNYHECILDGSWTSSREILTDALAKLDAKKVQEIAPHEEPEDFHASVEQAVGSPSCNLGSSGRGGSIPS